MKAGAELACCACLYFEPHEFIDTTRKGECRRHAPSAIAGARQAWWPDVSEDDWCGEFESCE
jgi:hypothetical protein